MRWTSSNGNPRLPRSRTIVKTVSAFLITSTSLSLQSELPAALRHVIGATVSDYCGGSVTLRVSPFRQSRFPSIFYVLASFRQSTHLLILSRRQPSLPPKVCRSQPQTSIGVGIGIRCFPVGGRVRRVKIGLQAV